MSEQDNTLTADDDDIEIVETDKIPANQDDKVSQQETDEDDQSETDEDDRLGDNEDDDSSSSKTERNRKLRKERKERRDAAEARARQELDFLRNQNAQMQERLAALEGNTLTTAQTQLESQIAAVQREIEQAEYVLAKATEAGNGEDVVAALRLRDQAVAKRNTYESQKQAVETQRTRPQTPQIDPRVTTYAQQWTAANPWFDPNGSDEDSRITKAIDDGLVREGYNPASQEYWVELTNRVNKRLGGEPVEKTPRRQVPPQGKTREHAPGSTRNEVYVTPERKQAMIDAGIWDDPVRRNKMLKAYQQYDRENSAS